jgi:hypothetical protein
MGSRNVIKGLVCAMRSDFKQTALAKTLGFARDLSKKAGLVSSNWGRQIASFQSPKIRAWLELSACGI